MSVAQGAKPAARITRLKIEKFRAIGHAEIELGDTIALVGQNGAGKSSVLRALNAFFNFESERQAFEDGLHRYSAAQTIIEVSIEGLKHASLPTFGLRNDFRGRLKFRRKPIWQVWRNGGWESVPSFQEALREQITYALVPIRRDHEVAHSSSGGLLELAVERWVSSHSQRDRRSPQIAKVADRLRKNSLSGLEKQLRAIAPLDGPFSFELSYAVSPDYRLLLQNLALSVNEGGQSIPLADSGSGTQSMAVFALYAYLAELEGKTYMLGLEEPEQNLHPQAQQQLIRNLRHLGLQVIITTHSPTIVDMLDHEHVVLCKRTQGKQRDLEVRISQISRTFFTDHGLDRERYYKFHRRRNSEFLFADYVVVTEGPIDAAVVERLLDDAGRPIDQLGISVVPLDGVSKGNLSYMFHLLRGLQIEAAFVVDRDYFVPYKRGERDNSLDGRGFPQYEARLREGCVLADIVHDDLVRAKLIEDLASQPSEAMRALAALGFFCFMWALEIDLVNAASPRDRMHDELQVPQDERTTSALLVGRKKAIKRQEVLLAAISGLPASALPTSYKTLRREIPRLAQRARSK